MKKRKPYTISVFEHVTSNSKLKHTTEVFKSFGLKFKDYSYLLKSFANGDNRVHYWKGQ